MNCDEAKLLTSAYGDGELESLRALSVERHLAGCPECAASREAFVVLRSEIRRCAPYYAAPAALRERVARLVPAAAEPAQPRSLFFSGVALGCAATILVWFIATTAVGRFTEEGLAREAVTSHVHATLADRLLSVASTDSHTVKPWLTAHLDYAPPVKDLAAQGFPLMGARIDRLDERAVAVLVYGYRNHRIGVFVRPHEGGELATTMSTVRGFNVAHARRGGMEWVAVSDLNAETLHDLAASLARSD